MAKNSFAVWKTPFWARHLPSKILGCSTSTVSVFSFHFHRASQTNVKVHRQWSTRSALCPSFVACCGRPPVLTLKAQYAAQGTEPTAANRRSEINNVAAGRLCREKKKLVCPPADVQSTFFVCFFCWRSPPPSRKKRRTFSFLAVMDVFVSFVGRPYLRLAQSVIHLLFWSSPQLSSVSWHLYGYKERTSNGDVASFPVHHLSWTKKLATSIRWRKKHFSFFSVVVDMFQTQGLSLKM